MGSKWDIPESLGDWTGVVCLQQNTTCWRGTHGCSQSPSRDQGGSGSLPRAEKLLETGGCGGHLHIQAALSPWNEHVQVKLGRKSYGGWGGAEGERIHDRSDQNTPQ